MNIIKKYWNAVYVYVLLLVPGFCMCAGIFWTVFKGLGYYPNLHWGQIITFDCTQFLYLAIAVYFIYRNKKDSSYIPEHLFYIKSFVVFALFVQYNFILYLFASEYVWGCTFLFFAVIVFLFDSKLMLLNIIMYAVSLLTLHILRPEICLPLGKDTLGEEIAFRIVIYILTSLCIMIVVYFVERFLMQVRESDEENVHLIEKQLEYYKDMDFLDTELRKFRHDIINHFMCMESLLQGGRMEELKEYFQDMQQSFAVQQKMHLSGNDIIDTILHHDLPHYCKEEVAVKTYGNLPAIRTVSAMDLCNLFSNLLSNAITSANQCVGSSNAEIAIHFSGGKSYFSISISNSIFSQNSVIERKRKGKKHGYGMYKIRDVLEKYDGRFEQSMDAQTLTTTVYLPI